MSKYINADKLIKDLRDNAAGHFDSVVNSIIITQPSADVVEVVRCKDCKHYTTDNGGGCNKENGGLMFATKTDFCSYGERKEAE